MAGCDSTVTLYLTINNSSSSIETLTACDSLTWHDSLYMQSTFNSQFSTLNSVGCDSVVTLHLTINNSTTAIEAVTACDSLTWHDSTYTVSTLYSQFSTLNSVGCDSTVTLHLTINNSSSSIETLTACDSLTWHDSTYTVSTLNSQFSTLNAVGCDSTVTLHLVIHYSTHDTIHHTERNNYLWNGTNYTESGEYLYEGVTSEGCDSVVVLVLTIIPEQGVSPVAGLDDIVVYPNPTTGGVTISSDEVQKVEIYDFLGRTVAVHTLTNKVDLSALPSGSYTMRISLPQGSTVRRIIKR